MPNPTYSGVDDTPLVVTRGDFSGGINTRQSSFGIGENQVEEISNYDISVTGELRKDKGITLIEDLGNDAGTGLFGFEPSGGTNVLVATHGTKLETWPGSSTFTERKTDFTTGLQTALIKVGESGIGDVFIAGNGTDNWFRFDPADYSSPQDLGSTAGTGNDSPPKSTVAVYFRNRLWIIKDNLWYFSDPYPADYSVAFDTNSNAFRCPIGTQRAAIALRDQGIVGFGADQIWALNPSATPDPTTDKPEKLLDIGCVANKSVVQVGDDILFLAKDGVRGLFRTQQDKLQTGTSLPLSYPLKTQFDALNWNAISGACAVYFDNKYFISVPVSSSGYNNQLWIYHPSTQSWRVRDDWNVAAWATMRVSGEDRLYFIDSNDGKVYRAFYGATDNSTAITSTFIGRDEFFGFPTQYKVGGELTIIYHTMNETSDLSVYVSIDNQAFQLLGTISMSSGTAPTLPIDLPFYLADNYRRQVKYHLESLGKFYDIQVKLTDSSTAASDVIIYGYSIKTFLEEYENE